jgi:hypothetical protein
LNHFNLSCWFNSRYLRAISKKKFTGPPIVFAPMAVISQFIALKVNRFANSQELAAVYQFRVRRMV